MIGIINGLMTLLLIILFIGIWVWAWSKGNKDKFDNMARMPLQEDVAKVKVDEEERNAE